MVVLALQVFMHVAGALELEYCCGDHYRLLCNLACDVHVCPNLSCHQLAGVQIIGGPCEWVGFGYWPNLGCLRRHACMCVLEGTVFVGADSALVVWIVVRTS